MDTVPIVTEAGASMRDYMVFWVCVAGCVLGASYVLHCDLVAIAAVLTELNETARASEPTSSEGMTTP